MPASPGASFAVVAVMMGLDSYIAHKQRSGQFANLKDKGMILHYAIPINLQGAYTTWPPSSMVRLLLEGGCSPNLVYGTEMRVPGN
jgi:hypothetical protein